MDNDRDNRNRRPSGAPNRYRSRRQVAVLFALARRAEVVRRATRVGLVVGTVLVAINHGDKMLAGDIGVRDLIKIGITYLVPYCVCTYGCVTSVSGRQSDSHPSQAGGES